MVKSHGLLLDFKFTFEAFSQREYKSFSLCSMSPEQEYNLGLHFKQAKLLRAKSWPQHPNTFFYPLISVSKVPFQDALDLVRARKVYLKAGFAYIPHQDIVTIVLNDFRTRLSKALAVSILKKNGCLGNDG